MQFSDTSNKNGIIQYCESLTNLGDTAISGNSTLLKQFTNYVNSGYYEVFMAIMSVDKTWKVDDFNYADFPEGPITMVASQRDYTLPVAVVGANLATLLRVNRVWVLDLNGVRFPLRKMNPDENFLYADDNYAATGFPTAYKLHGKSIYLDILPVATSVTLTDGLIVQVQRTPDAFTSADTTQQPGFMETYHDLLALKASAWYLLPTNPQLATMYEERFRTRLELLKRDYAQKDDNLERNFTSEPIFFR